MAETRCLPVIEEEETIDDDFYEKIEAPKYVDLTALDLRRSDEDRHWFCLRFGCDQKHEQELDSEAIYKNFVLRVMAARSPNVRLRKALNRREACEKLKCPLTAPAKPRVSRIAYISSFSHKMADNNNVKATKPLAKVSATPNAKVKQSPSVARALTTPRNQKKVSSNVEPFRTVQSKKAMNVVVPKSRAVAKTLVFHSPKKAVKIKRSIELNSHMKALCSAMRKLELHEVKKNNGEGCNKPLPAAASGKKLRGREVKSRVFDSLYSNNRKGPEAHTVRCLKEKKVKGLKKCQVNVLHEETENDSSDMEIDEKSRGDSLGRCTESGTSESGTLSLGAENSHEPTRGESSVQVLPKASITTLPNSKEEKKNTEGNENEEKRKPVSEKGEVPQATKRKDEENSMAFDDKENEVQLTENDDKENASAPDENRVVIINKDTPKKAILGSKLEGSRKTDKKSTLVSTGSQVVKYRKLKPTNPKPFKLRTDERGILKEANLDKKVPSPLKETTVKGGKVQHKLSATTPHRNPGPKLQKPIDDGSEHRDKDAGKLDGDFTRTSQMMQCKTVRPRGALSRKKEKVLLSTPCKMSVILEKTSTIVKPKEAAEPLQNDASSPATKASTSRPCSRGRRTLTVPREPKFHSLHVPKSCTIRKLT